MLKKAKNIQELELKGRNTTCSVCGRGYISHIDKKQNPRPCKCPYSFR